MAIGKISICHNGSVVLPYLIITAIIFSCNHRHGTSLALSSDYFPGSSTSSYYSTTADPNQRFQYHNRPSFGSNEGWQQRTESKSEGSLFKKRGRQQVEEPEEVEFTHNTKPNQEHSLIQEIYADKGLRNFILRTYLFSGSGILVTLALAQAIAVSRIPNYLDFNQVQYAVGFASLLVLASSLFISFGQYTVRSQRVYIRDSKTNERINKFSPLTYWYSKNSALRLASYLLLVVSMGVVLSPTVFIAGNFISPYLFPTAITMASLIFGAASIFALKSNINSLLSWRSPIISGFFGLLGLSLLSLIAAVFPQNEFVMNFIPGIEALQSVHSYVSILLFTAMIAYDTQKASAQYKNKDPDHLGCALELYLDFIRILMEVMKIFARSKIRQSNRNDDSDDTNFSL